MPVSEEFARCALLASLHIRTCGARKVDKKTSRKVAADNGASDDAGHYQKNLVPKAALEPVTKAVSELRAFHNDNTLPWLDEGVRCLPSMNYEAYKTELESLRDKFDQAARNFAAQWPEIIAEARRELGALFSEADYPADVLSRFGVDVRIMPMNTAEDFRVNISDTERDLLRRQIEGTLEDAHKAAMGDLYTRIATGVKAMAERLQAYKVDETTGKTSGVFRDSLVDNLRELVDLVPRLNMSGDPELARVVAEVRAELCGNDAQVLRDSDLTRERTRESAEAIADRLGAFLGA